MRKLSRLFVACLLIISMVQVQIKADKSRPPEKIFGDERKVKWSEAEQIWINYYYFIDNVLCVPCHDPELQARVDRYIAELKKPKRIPARKVIIIRLRENYYRRPEAHMVLGAAMMLEAKRQQRFVLINVDKTPDYEEQ